jgi:hypothetical protein
MSAGDEERKGHTFGRVFADEREILMKEGFDGDHLLVLLAIRSLGSGDTTRANITTLARAVGVPYSTFDRKLDELVARGAVERPGVKHSRRATTILPPASWPERRSLRTSNRYAVAVTHPEQLVTHSEQLVTQTHGQNGTERNGKRNGETLSGPSDLEGAALTKRLTAEWLATRESRGLTNWIDGKAVAWLREKILEARSSGIDPSDIERCVRSYARTDWADPRDLRIKPTEQSLTPDEIRARLGIA